MVNCPLIAPGLKKVSLSVVDDLSRNHVSETAHGIRVEPGVVVRHVGRYDDVEEADSEPVTFLSTPHLVLHGRGHLDSLHGNQQVVSLPQSLYKYDVDANRSHSPIGKKLGLWPEDQALFASELWCLTVGTGIFVTFVYF